LCAALALLCASATADSTVVTGAHFRVVCHFEAGREAREALQAAEAAWPLAAEFYGLDPRAKRSPMDVHLYRTMRDYAIAEWPITRGRFRHTGAFSAFKTRAAYVAVQPDCSDEVLRNHGLPMLTRLIVAHEACHVVSYHATKNFSGHPAWYAEGFATWVASKVLSDDRGPGLEAAPFSAHLMTRLRRIDAGGGLPRADQILAGDMGRLGFYDRYAVWWGFFRTLMEGPSERAFRAIATEANAGTAPNISPFLQQRMRRDLGGLADLDKRFTASVRAMRPLWDEQRRSLEVAGRDLLQRAFATSPALAWSASPVDKPAYSIQGRVTVLPGYAHSARLLIGRDTTGYWGVEFAAGAPVRLVRFGTGPRELATASHGACRVGVPLPFRVEVAGGRLKVRVNGRAAIEVPTGEHPTGGAWGIGLDSGAGALWRFAHHPGPPLIRSRPTPETRPAKLLSVIRKHPDSDDARRAVAALAAHGDPGLRMLERVIARYARKHPRIATLAARRIAEADTPLRFELLRKRYNARLPRNVRGAILVGLAPAYPENAKWIHAALAPRAAVAHTPEIFLEVAGRGLPVETVRACLQSAPTAALAFAELEKRNQPVKASELGLVARSEARLGTSLRYVAAYAKRLKANRGWTLLTAIAKLVDDKDERVRTGAHALLLGVSGKDVPAFPLLWRSWIAARRGEYELPDPLSEGSVAAAVIRGAAFLRRQLLAHGVCVYNQRDGDLHRFSYNIGATALAVKALRASGVPATDPAIERAVEETLLTRNEYGQLTLNQGALHTNYTAALTIMALAAVDKEAHSARIQRLASRLAAGQLESGQWSYNTPDRYARRDGKPRRLVGDASNTQYALLGLRAAMKAGADIEPEIWRRTLQMYRETQDPWGGWGYTVVPFSGRERTMTSAAIAAIVFCLEALHGDDAAKRIARSPFLRRGLVRQGQLLLGWGYRGFDHYAFYGIERACVLTGTRYFNNYDWYRKGALDLLARQNDDGSWHGRAAGRRVSGFVYGPHIDTAYALLFLKRATTAVAGVTPDSRVACKRGPGRVRGHMVPFWPHLPRDG
jgi:hypothetical protein